MAKRASAKHAPTKQSPEDYLRCIYKFESGGTAASTSRLAETLGIRMASVTGMVQKLAGEGLLHYKRYGGVRLTKKGMRMAIGVTRRHRLWEMFLVRILNFSWDEVHEIANMLEHATPPELEERMDALLGYPAIDPHGEPIPTKEGVVAQSAAIPLSFMQANQTAVIARVLDNPPALKQLTALGVALKQKIRVVNIAPLDGAMTVCATNTDKEKDEKAADGKEMYIAKDLAAQIFVLAENPGTAAAPVAPNSPIKTKQPKKTAARNARKAR